MDIPTRLLTALNFTESNLKEAVTPADMAAEAAMSLRSFQRHFRQLTGDSVKEYLRGRRLTLASQDLINSQARILDIALEYQFQSQEVFTRAFQRMFWQSPGTFRTIQSEYAPQQKLAINELQLEQLLSTQDIQPEILASSGLTLLGCMIELPHQGLPLQHYYEAQAALTQEMLSKLPAGILPTTNWVYQVRFRKWPHGQTQQPLSDNHSVCFFSGIQLPENISTLPCLHSIRIPSGHYAIFEHSGSVELIHHTISYAFATWLPNSKYLFNLAAPVLTLHPLNTNTTKFRLALPITTTVTGIPVW